MIYKGLNIYSSECFGVAKSKGWWPQDTTLNGEVILSADEILAKLMLVVSELSEAVEFVRLKDFDVKRFTNINGKPEGFSIELIDALIRLLDLMGALGIDVENIYETKTRYNITRPDRHGGKRA